MSSQDKEGIGIGIGGWFMILLVFLSIESLILGNVAEWHANRVCNTTCEPKLGRIKNLKCMCYTENFE